jgi:ATP-dependent DNA ligase
MDLFDRKNVTPMLIAENKEPFDSHDYLYELKLDGFRCVAYLDIDSTDLRSKQNNSLIRSFPELSGIHHQSAARCILDGEILILEKGRPNLGLMQRRAMLSDYMKIRLAASANPASYVAYDILYCDGQELLDTPLLERKQILSMAVIESERIAVSRWIDTNGSALFTQVKALGLEGVVAKRKGSYYYMGKQTKDWAKFKYPEYSHALLSE